MQFTVPHKTRALRTGEIFGQLAAVGAPPMKINLTYKWEVLESPWHYTTVECTWGKRADLQKLLTDAAQFPNVAIGGQGEEGRAWVTVGGKGTKTGSLSSLQCPDIARVHMVTNVDGTESFTMVQSGTNHAEDLQRARDAMNEKEMEASVKRTAKQTHLSNMSLVNQAVEQTTRLKGMMTAMASFVGLEEDQLRDAKEKHEDSMPTFAWLEVEK